MIVRDFQQLDQDAVEKIYDLYWSDDFRKKLTRKIDEYVNMVEKAREEDVHYYVAEENGEIIGAISWRKCPDLMLKHVKTSHSIEIYILAVKNKGQGVGKKLIEKTILDARSVGYTEAVLFNGNLHSEARDFYKKIGFSSAGVATAPDGELGEALTIIF